jgi:AraC-like DNA-binding protein
MLEIHNSLRETHLIGPRCRESNVFHERCPIIKTLQIENIGHSEIRPPYRMVRLDPTFSHIVACFGGRGRTLIEGRWQPWEAGQVLLTPPHALHAFEPAGEEPWKIAWLFYEQPPGTVPVVAYNEPILIKANVASFVAVLQAFCREVGGEAERSVIQSLAALIDLYARRFAGSIAANERIWGLWGQVEADLARKWTNAELARHAAMSEEHLRRLCRRQYGRTPMAHVQHLRMLRACALLRTMPGKLDSIAAMVGYSSMFAFSAAFKRWAGVPPSAYRQNSLTKTGLVSQPLGHPGGEKTYSKLHRSVSS